MKFLAATSAGIQGRESTDNFARTSLHLSPVSVKHFRAGKGGHYERGLFNGGLSRISQIANSLESLENGRSILCFMGSRKSLKSLNPLEMALSEKTPFSKNPFSKRPLFPNPIFRLHFAFEDHADNKLKPRCCAKLSLFGQYCGRKWPQRRVFFGSLVLRNLCAPNWLTSPKTAK